MKASKRRRTILASVCLWLVLAEQSGLGNAQSTYGPGDPGIKDAAYFDVMRPLSQEMSAHVPDGFTMTAVGDLIISRPLSQYAERFPDFSAALKLLTTADVTYGNLETVIFDSRTFKGSAYPWDGDWTLSSTPAVAADLKKMGFKMVSRANNHALDFGVAGMRETSQHLDTAGIAHAGSGDTYGTARAPQYFETTKGRVALVSVASTFRPNSNAEPPAGVAPGRPGISVLHLTSVLTLPAEAFAAAQKIRCAGDAQRCGDVSDEAALFGTQVRKGERYSREYAMDPEDLADIYKSIRSAQENADFVIVTIHSHECSLNCESDAGPYGPGDFMKQFARDAIDSGADAFVVTGNHNLGPIEVYHSKARGTRPIFYGLASFFWSDIQEVLPHDLLQENRSMLARAWNHPSRVTDYDLTAPLNNAWFAHPFTFQSVVARVRFDGNQLSQIELHAVELGYGRPLTESGIPQLVTNEAVAATIFNQIVTQTAQFELPKLNISYRKGVATIVP